MERVLCNATALSEVAQELGLELSFVKQIVATQSEYTSLVMSSNSFDSIRWPYFGVFKSKPKEVQMINHLKGMTPEQQADFKRKVRTKQIVLNHWEKKNVKSNTDTGDRL